MYGPKQKKLGTNEVCFVFSVRNFDQIFDVLVIDLLLNEPNFKLGLNLQKFSTYP